MQSATSLGLAGSNGKPSQMLLMTSPTNQDVIEEKER